MRSYAIPDSRFSVDAGGRYLGIDVPGATYVPFAYPDHGQEYRWNFETHGWEAAWAVDADGRQLPSLFDPSAALVVTTRPATTRATWAADRLEWVPAEGEVPDVVEQTVIGGEVVRVTYRGNARSPAAVALREAVRDRFPDVDLSDAGTIGLVRASAHYPEDVVTVYFFKDLPEELKRRSGVSIDSKAYSLKLGMASGRRALKVIDQDHRRYALPPVPADAFISGVGLQRALDAAQSPVDTSRDVYVFCSDERMMDFCRSLDLEFPEEADPGCAGQRVFGLTFDVGTLRITKTKRYYL